MREQTPDEVFAHRFRQVREAAGLTQREVARIATEWGHRMYHTTVAKIEAGTRPVSLADAVYLAEIVGVPLEMLTGQSEGDAGPKHMVLIRRALRLAEETEQARRAVEWLESQSAEVAAQLAGEIRKETQ